MRWRPEPWHPNLGVTIFAWLSCTAVSFAASWYLAGAVLFPKTGAEIVIAPAVTGAIITFCFGRSYAVASANTIALGTFIYVLFLAEDFGLRRDLSELVLFSLILGLLAVLGMAITIGVRYFAALALCGLSRLWRAPAVGRARSAFSHISTSVRRTITHRAAP